MKTKLASGSSFQILSMNKLHREWADQRAQVRANLQQVSVRSLIKKVIDTETTQYDQ
jgi:hypothetical protein